MTIQLENIGKKFGKSWVFKDLNVTFLTGQSTAILGSNGSGKSTLLNIISGMGLPTEGVVSYKMSENILVSEKIYSRMTIAAPYMDLMEEFTLKEMVGWHRRFKTFVGDLSADAFIRQIELEGHEHKTVASFSSGMKQRLKLGLALLSEVDLILLDEPLTNLDETGRKWYKELIQNIKNDRLIIVCSNYVEDEISFCTNRFEL